MSTDGIYFQVFREITSGKVELPGLPDVAMKVRQAISDENNDINTVVRIIQTDPGLSAHLVRRANSPLHRTRVPAENLANAVRCFGLDGTCNMVTSYILQNMFLSRSKVVRTLLAEVWRQSVKVASISAVLASKCRGFDPDSAMLAGLLHDIGSLPLLNRLGRHTRAKLDENEARKVLDDLSPQVGTVMLRQWEFDERFVEVVRRRNAWDHDPAAAVDLADLVQVARLHSYIGTPLMANFPRIDEVTAFAKLPLVNCRRR
jgi:HD-like signal output (HDOD) protein